MSTLCESSSQTGVDFWVVVGARRWARLVATELCNTLPFQTEVFMLADAVDPELQQWVIDSGFEGRIQIVQDFPTCPASKTGVALVVNSGYLHRKSAEVAMSAGYHVVCEKPVSLSLEEIQTLMKMAENRGLEFFSTNTYLFAGFLESFKSDWLIGQQFTGVRVNWADPRDEERYGEKKFFDSGVPLIIDVLPHVANILLATVGISKAIPVSCIFSRGGSSARLNYETENYALEIGLERNSVKRRREIEFFSSTRKVRLDFSIEPGEVYRDKELGVPIDFDTEISPRPITAMIQSVLEFFGSGVLDSRLACLSGLYAANLIDGVIERYVESQVRFLSEKHELSGPHPDSEDYAYARKEAISIATRVLPHLPKNHPLRDLAALGGMSATNRLIRRS